MSSEKPIPAEQNRDLFGPADSKFHPAITLFGRSIDGLLLLDINNGEKANI
jgi:hypothetical protein